MITEHMFVVDVPHKMKEGNSTMANENMKISQKGRNLIKEFEGLVLNAYQDSVGVWTIGYGHTQGVYPGMTISIEQANVFLDQDIKSHAYGIYNFVKVELNQNQFDAMVSFHINLGAYILQGTTLLNYINNKQWLAAATEMNAYINAGGVPLEGLIRRRKAESTLFLEEVVSPVPIITQGGPLQKKGIEYRAHIPQQGDLGFVQESQIAGTVGKNIPLQAVDVFYNGSNSVFEINSHVSGLGWINTNHMLGTKGQNKNLEAFKATFKGVVGNRFNLMYRSHTKNIGWGEWVSNNQISGTVAKNLPIEAIQFKMSQKRVDQGTLNPAKQGLEYRTHIQNQGWLGYVKNGATSGTTERAIPVEGLQVMIDGQMLELQGHVSQLGWQSVGTTAGLIGKALNLEAFKINSAKVVYRAYVQDLGWQDWKKNGEVAGTIGQAKQVEAIEVKVV